MLELSEYKAPPFNKALLFSNLTAVFSLNVMLEICKAPPSVALLPSNCTVEFSLNTISYRVNIRSSAL